ncbi:hypothetical protein C4D60_Mb05t29540 [Musa balbisiana]|uniref:C3H1-type domain-containing protein n=1 Tax=Musa balbisiana TaxID=52838 RepID=A0A4S8JZS6_MUSBA|nr:hypothetical protein C4D60_Mb05t29540 [Musa balbisiana]
MWSGRNPTRNIYEPRRLESFRRVPATYCYKRRSAGGAEEEEDEEEEEEEEEEEYYYYSFRFTSLMDAYEATRIVFSRIQNLDPNNAAKIMGLLLLQEHGEKEMIRLAFGPETQLHSVVLKARKEIGLVSVPTSSAPGTPSAGGAPASPFLLRQNSASRLLSGGLPSPLAVSSPSSWAPPSVFSRSNSGTGLNGSLDELQNSDELISPSNVSVSPFYGGGGGGDLVDEFHLPDQLSFLGDPAAALDSSHSVSITSKLGGDMFHPDIECRSPSGNGDGALFPYGMGWGVNGYHHRRSCSAADLCLGDPAAGFGWKPCLYFARGYCKNGTACRFLHGLPEEAAAAAAVAAGTKMDGVVEQQFQELLLRAAAAAAAAALMLGGDEAHKFMGRSRLERSDLMANPGSRQIYLTFPADSTFREEDVSNYFSIYGPVQDVRIPYQQKRMFGFVTFVYPETVKLILAKGNPHFVCDSRVLVKPYKEKGKVPDKYRQSFLNLHHKKQQQHAERGDFSACTTPTALDARDAYDLQLLGWILITNKKSLSAAAPEEKVNSGHGLLQQKAEQEESAREANPNEDGGFQESAEHNLPDSPFASPPTKSPFMPDSISAGEEDMSTCCITNNSSNNNSHLIASTLLPTTSSLDVSSFSSSCFFQMPRFSSGHGAVGM